MLGFKNRLLSSRDGGKGALSLYLAGPDPVELTHWWYSIQHWSSSSLWERKKRNEYINEMSETVHEMEADIPAYHETATPGHFDSHLGLLEHSPFHFREERQRPQTLAVWDSRSFCNNNHCLVFDSKMTINDSRRSRVCGDNAKEKQCDFILSDEKVYQY